MSTARGTAAGSVKGSDLLDSARRRTKVRTCKDCTLPNPGSENHTDPDYCPTCVHQHLTHCQTCRNPFRRDGRNKVCRSCRDQLALFGARS